MSVLGGKSSAVDEVPMVVRDEEAREVVAVLKGLVRALSKVLCALVKISLKGGDRRAHRAGGVRGVADEDRAALVPHRELRPVVQTKLQRARLLSVCRNR